MISKHPHVIIVGAGIVGASLAYHLVRQNARVTLIDKATKPANGVTQKSFGWITAGHDTPEAYLHLRQEAITDWRRVEDELNGQLTIDWSGALTWFENTAETERIARKLIQSGYGISLVDEQEIRLLEPNLKHAPDRAIFAKDEGAIDAALTTELFVNVVREKGADIQLDNEVITFITNGSRIAGVVTANGNVTADVVVVAAGANTVTLCQSIGLMLPIFVSPAILIKFHTHRRFVNRIVSNPLMEIRAAARTLILAEEDYIDDSIENNPQAIAQRTLKKIKEHWYDTEQMKLANVVVGKRAIPQDNLPIIGRTTDIDGLYLSVMHSGVTLAAIAGRLAAAELLSEQESNLLSLYRPKRFNSLQA